MLLTAFLLIAVVWGCSTKERPSVVDGFEGDPGGSVQERAPCSVEGEVKSCGRVVRMDGNYVTCSEGHTVCTGGKWAPCIGDPSSGSTARPSSFSTIVLSSTSGCSAMARATRLAVSRGRPSSANR